MLWLTMAMTASADTFTLDNGAVIEGQMVVYSYGGECQMSITEGDLVGSIVLIPCDRITSFARGLAVPAPPMEAPSLAAAAIEDALSEPVSVASVVVEPVPEPIAAEPVPELAVLAVPVAEPVEVIPESIEEPLLAEEVAPPPEVMEVATLPAQAPFAEEQVEPVPEEAAPEAVEPIEEAPEAMAATPWADESGQPADGLIRHEPTRPERSIGGVVIPALPNLRIIRSQEPAVAPDSSEE